MSGCICARWVMFVCIFTKFSESYLWECRVFNVFADNLMISECIFTGFAENHLCRSLWEALGGFGRVLQALRGFVRLWAVLKGFQRLWEALGGFRSFGRLCHALGGFGFGRLWEAFENPWGALGGCGFSIVCL